LSLKAAALDEDPDRDRQVLVIFRGSGSKRRKKEEERKKERKKILPLYSDQEEL
jgi:hypothetical protein